VVSSVRATDSRPSVADGFVFHHRNSYPSFSAVGEGIIVEKGVDAQAGNDIAVALVLPLLGLTAKVSV